MMFNFDLTALRDKIKNRRTLDSGLRKAKLEFEKEQQ